MATIYIQSTSLFHQEPKSPAQPPEDFQAVVFGGLPVVGRRGVEVKF